MAARRAASAADLEGRTIREVGQVERIKTGRSRAQFFISALGVIGGAANVRFKPQRRSGGGFETNLGVNSDGRN
jgi:hypothetical protein